MGSQAHLFLLIACLVSSITIDVASARNLVEIPRVKVPTLPKLPKVDPLPTHPNLNVPGVPKPTIPVPGRNLLDLPLVGGGLPVPPLPQLPIPTTVPQLPIPTVPQLPIPTVPQLPIPTLPQLPIPTIPKLPIP